MHYNYADVMKLLEVDQLLKPVKEVSSTTGLNQERGEVILQEFSAPKEIIESDDTSREIFIEGTLSRINLK